MKPKQRLGIALRRVAHCGVPAAATVKRPTPRNRMVGAHLAAGIAPLVERRQYVYRAARVAAEIVPFVCALPDRRQVTHRRMGAIFDLDRPLLNLGVAREIGADEPPVPGPLILGVAGRVDAGEPAAGPNVAFKSSLLAIVEDIARRAQEHDDSVSS